MNYIISSIDRIAGKFAIGFSNFAPVVKNIDGKPVLDQDGTPIKAKLFVSEKVLLKLADKAGLDNASVGQARLQLKGASISGLTYQKAGTAFVDFTTKEEKESTQDGFAPVKLKVVEVDLSAVMLQSEINGLNYSKSLNATSSKIVNILDDIDEIEEEVEEEEVEEEEEVDLSKDKKTSKKTSK